MTVLWHGDDPIGICVFTTPGLALAQRHRFFGLSGKWSSLQMKLLNTQLVRLARVVIHPTYRGAGLASQFVRRSCEAMPWPWIETLAEMGRIHPFFERAGFTRVGPSTSTKKRSREAHSALYGAGKTAHGRPKLVSPETYEKSHHAEPVYYVFDNRKDDA